jgi:ubiquinone/menaquinone biosynthesis C-methylase UbiE
MTRFFYLFLSLCIFSLSACFTDGNFSNSNVKKSLDDSTFNEMVRDFEDEDRIVWQKPEIILEKLGDLTGKTVADVGAGTGYFSFRMLRSAKKVIALDIEPRFIHFIDSISTELPEAMSAKLETRLVENQSTNLKDNEIDNALMVNTYMFISNRASYLKELMSNLTSNGKLVIIDFKKKDLPVGPSLEEKLDAALVVKELQEVGFQNVVLDDLSLDYQYVITANK